MPRHPTERDLQRLTLKQVAASIGRSERETKKLIEQKLGFLPSTHRRDGRYDRRLVTVLHQLLGQPAERTPSASADWLSQYQSQEDPHA